MDDHFREAAGGCECQKCQAIRSVWDAGLVVVRRIVFETIFESEALKQEKARIVLHSSPYLTNIVGIPKTTVSPVAPSTQEKDANLAALLRRLATYEEMPISSRFQHAEYFNDLWEWDEQHPIGKSISNRLFALCASLDAFECARDENDDRRRLLRSWYEGKCQEIGIEPDSNCVSIATCRGH
jgi:hypothetical protein